MEAAAAADAAQKQLLRVSSLLASSSLLRLLISYSTSGRVDALTFPTQRAALSAKVETLSIKSITHTVDSLHVGAIILLFVSEVTVNFPPFASPGATRINAEEAMAFFSGGQFLLLLISSITTLDATSEIILTCSVHNAQDFIEDGDASIANRRSFPPGSAFDVKLNAADIPNLRFVTSRNVCAFQLRPSPAAPVLIAPQIVAPHDNPMLDAMRTISMPEGKRSLKRAITDQINIRDVTVFGGSKGSGSLVLKARQALVAYCPHITLSDEQILSVVVFSLRLTESSRSGDLKAVQLKDLFLGLFPHADEPPSCDYKTLTLCMPALQLLWSADICSELSTSFAKACMLMLGASTPKEDSNRIYAVLWEVFTVAVSSVSPTTSLHEFIQSFSYDSTRMEKLVSLFATIRSNKLTRPHTLASDDGEGVPPVEYETSIREYCIFALNKCHMECPEGEECQRIWRDVPFSRLDAKEVKKRIRALYDGSKRKAEDGTDHGSKKPRAEEED